jgi:hypothetical protein
VAKQLSHPVTQGSHASFLIGLGAANTAAQDHLAGISPPGNFSPEERGEIQTDRYLTPRHKKRLQALIALRLRALSAWR